MMPCKLWTSATNKGGYGIRRYKGKTALAHRVVFFEEHGFWPAVVMHTCDNPPCIEIEHLRAGDNTSNVRDMEAKGRAQHPYGEAHGKTTLTEKDVRSIRQSPASVAATAELFGVSAACVYDIQSRRSWKHLR